TQLLFVRAYDEDRARHSLQELVTKHAAAVNHGGLTASGWTIADERIKGLLNTMRLSGSTMGQSIGSTPPYGLKNGLKQAVYLDDEKAQYILTEEPHSSSLIMPFVRGRDVKRWAVSWARQWHIVVPSSQNRRWPWADAANDRDAERVFAATYPVVHAHLK